MKKSYMCHARQRRPSSQAGTYSFGGFGPDDPPKLERTCMPRSFRASATTPRPAFTRSATGTSPFHSVPSAMHSRDPRHRGERKQGSGSRALPVACECPCRPRILTWIESAVHFGELEKAREHREGGSEEPRVWRRERRRSAPSRLRCPIPDPRTMLGWVAGCKLPTRELMTCGFGDRSANKANLGSLLGADRSS